VRRIPNRDVRVAPRRRTRYFLFQPSLPLIQATLVRGAFGVTSTDASRSDSIAQGALEFKYMPLAQVALSITSRSVHVNT
jgi:hypothetical protein